MSSVIEKSPWRIATSPSLPETRVKECETKRAHLCIRKVRWKTHRVRQDLISHHAFDSSHQGRTQRVRRNPKFAPLGEFLQNSVHDFHELQKPGHQDDLLAIVPNPPSFQQKEFSKLLVLAQERQHHVD